MLRINTWKKYSQLQKHRKAYNMSIKIMSYV